MQKADKAGRPWYGLVPTLLVGGGLAYLNVSYGKFALQVPYQPQTTPPED
jgi:amino acid permease